MHPRMIKKRIFYEKNAPQARFLMKSNAPQARLIKCAAGKTYKKNPEGSFPDRSFSFLNYSSTKPKVTVSSYLVHFVSWIKCVQKCQKIAGCAECTVYNFWPLIASNSGSSPLKRTSLDNITSQPYADAICPHTIVLCTLSCPFLLKERDKAEISTIRDGTRASCVRPWLTRDIV